MNIAALPSGDLPFLALAGLLLLCGGTVAATLLRRRPDALVAYGALADAGVACIGLGYAGPAGTTGAMLLFTFQLVARLLALCSLYRLAGPAPLTLDAMQGRGTALPVAGTLFGFGMFAALGVSPFLVPEGRTMVMQAALAGGLLLPVLMAVCAAVMAWLTVTTVQRICLEKGTLLRMGGQDGATPAMTVLTVLLAACGLGAHQLAGAIATLWGFAPEALPHLAMGWHIAAIVPFAGAFATWLLGRKLPAARNMLTVALAAIALGLAATAGDLDPLARLFAVITGVIGLVVAAYSVGYIHEDNHTNGYHFFLLLMLGSLMGIATTRNFGGFYGFWELMTFSSYFLVVHERTPEAFRAGVKYFVMCATGAYFMLPGLLQLGSGGDLGFEAVTAAVLALDPMTLKAALLLTLAGFAVKAGLVPVHSWLPDAHPVAPSSISGPLSGLLTKTGIYGIARIFLAVCGTTVLLRTGEGAGLSWPGMAVTTLGVLTMAYGEFMALKQDDLKRMLAYSTMGQIGEIATIIGLGTWLATTGALMHVLNHAVMKNLLFLGAGALIMRSGSRKLADLAGLGRMMPWTTTCIVIGVLSIMGLPPFNGFAGKYIMLTAAVDAGHAELAVALLLASLAGAVYYMRIVRVLVFMRREDAPVVAEAPWLMRLPLMLLAGLCVVLGLAPQLALSLVTPVADMLAGSGKLVSQALPLLGVTWPPYVIIPMLGAALPVLLRNDRKLAGYASAAVLLVATIAAAVAGRDLDAISYGFLLLIPLMGCLNMIYAVGYMEHSHTQWRFYTFFLFMVGGLMGVAAATDLFALFTFWEIMSSWSLYFVIVHEEFPSALREGFKYFFFNVLGAGFLFLGVVLLTVASGSPVFETVRAMLPQMPVAISTAAVALMAIGFTMKAAQLPFRIDIQMHPATAPTPVSGYISSVLLKSALFGLFKLFLVLGGGAALAGAATAWHQETVMYALAWVGGITIVMAAFMAVMQSDLKLVLIYSTVSQLGYMVLGVALGSTLGVAGGLLHLANHVLFKDLLFLVAGALILQTHKSSLDQLGGIGRKMPVTLAVFAVGALSVVGVPPTNGFTSKWIIYRALMAQGEAALAMLSLVGSVLTLAYFAKYLHTAFLGQPSKDIEHVHEAPRVMLVPMVLLAIGCVLTGIFPGLFLGPIDIMMRSVGMAGLDVTLSGIASGPGSWNATSMGVLVLVAFGLGWLVLRAFTRNVRITNVHSCGVGIDPNATRMAADSVYSAPMDMARGLTAAKER